MKGSHRNSSVTVSPPPGKAPGYMGGGGAEKPIGIGMPKGGGGGAKGPSP